MPGVQTLFPLLYTYGVVEGRLTMQRLLQVLAQNTARIFELSGRKGEIKVGADADLTIWNPKGEYVIADNDNWGNADWSPYSGMRIAGQLEHTILRGKFVVESGRFVGDASEGRLLRRP